MPISTPARPPGRGIATRCTERRCHAWIRFQIDHYDDITRRWNSIMRRFAQRHPDRATFISVTMRSLRHPRGAPEPVRGLEAYKLLPASDDVPERWDTGTQNHEALAGLVAAVDYLAGLDGGTDGGRRERIAAHNRALAARFLAGLDELPPVRMWGISDRARLAERTPTFAIRIGEEHPAESAKRLAERRIAVWDGDYCAREIMVRLGLLESGCAVRVGFCHCHTPAEVDRVVAHSLSSIVGPRPRRTRAGGGSAARAAPARSRTARASRWLCGPARTARAARGVVR
jgi:hypothetical protein